MARLIDADALKSEMKEILKDDESGCIRTLGSLLLVVIEACIDAQPTVEERKKGKWMPGREIARHFLLGDVIHVEYEDWRCSECGVVVEEYEFPRYKYCPNCGADMRGD